MKREKPWLRGNFTKALYKPNGKWTPSDIAPHSAIHAHSCILWTHQRGTLARRHEQPGIGAARDRTTNLSIRSCPILLPELLPPHYSMWLKGKSYSWRKCHTILYITSLEKSHVKNEELDIDVSHSWWFFFALKVEFTVISPLLRLCHTEADLNLI